MIIIGGISFFLVPSVALSLFDPIVVAALGYALYLKPSRLAAICLFLTSISGVVVTFYNSLGIETGGFGGKNIFLSLFLLYAGYQGLVGTFGYHKFSKTSLNVKTLG